MPMHRRQSWGSWRCREPPDFGLGAVGRSQERGRGRVVKYHYNLIMYRKYARNW